MLADQMGNLLSRICSPRLLAKMTPWSESADRDEELDLLLSGLRHTFEGRMESMAISKACEGVMEAILAVSVWFPSCASRFPSRERSS